MHHSSDHKELVDNFDLSAITQGGGVGGGGGGGGGGVGGAGE